jgi:hypothetical protein
MKNIVYALCLIPGICFLTFQLTKNDFDSDTTACFVWVLSLLGTLLLSSLIATLLGIWVIATATSDRKPKVEFYIATVVAALPGMLVLLSFFLK